ncbi:MAG: flavin-nucleotide-binding protein [Flavobacteriaceae bacterium]|nr:flavin-nucleotide-binding protein [Flavobacteriaceae bacterium]|tara:strand:+ start:33778 stop:34236 length:459 start_codon:yes stop_codon:yes gene_type:complete
MKLSEAVKSSISNSVLCWLATTDNQGQPNVSPKEIFADFRNEYIIIANIASPKTVKNIATNPKVCLSFIDILIQKGYQVKGTAEIIDKENRDFEELNKVLFKMAGDKFPYASITRIQVEQVKPILAPSYLLYPETKESDQIENAKKQYGLTR